MELYNKLLLFVSGSAWTLLGMLLLTEVEFCQRLYQG